MRHPLARSLVAGLALALAPLSSFAAAPAEWRPLFDGTLRGWHSWLATRPGNDAKTAAPLGWDNDPLGIFTVVNVDGGPTLRAAGPVVGFIATKESFHDYHLRLQFKWGTGKWAPRENLPRDSGLHFHVCGEPGKVGGVWAPCVEFQIQEHDTGDLWAINTSAALPGRVGNDNTGYPSVIADPTAPAVIAGRTDSPSNHAVKLADHEKPHGEWNTLELFCVGDAAVYFVNGHEVLRLAKLRRRDDDQPLSSGPIALQAECAEVFFRGIELRPLQELPAAAP